MGSVEALDIRIATISLNGSRRRKKACITGSHCPGQANTANAPGQGYRRMNLVTHTIIANFNWGIDDDVLCDVYVRGKYRDVILPMRVIRSLPCRPG